MTGRPWGWLVGGRWDVGGAVKNAVEQYFVRMEGENGRSDPKCAPTYGV